MAIRRDLFVAFGLLLFATLRPALASVIEYDFWLDAPNRYPITHLTLYAAGPDGDAIDYSPVILPPTGRFQLSQQVDFTATRALVIGITERDKDDWWDIVMFTSPAYAASAQGLRYAELFLAEHAGYLGHNELTPLLQSAHGGDTSATARITDFLRGMDAAKAYFDPFGAYSIIQFSTVQPPIGGNVPEPPTWTLLVFGVFGVFGVLGVWGRRTHVRPGQPSLSRPR